MNGDHKERPCSTDERLIRLELMQKGQCETLARIETTINRQAALVSGDGTRNLPGLRRELDRLNSIASAALWILGVIVTALVGLIIDWFKRGFGKH